MVERRVVAPRPPGGLGELARAHQLPLTGDAPVLGAEQHPGAPAEERLARVAGHEQQEVPGLEWIGPHQVERVPGSLVVGALPAEAGGGEDHRQGRGQLAGPGVVGGAPEQQHRPARQVRGRGVVVGDHRTRVPVEEAPGETQRALAQHRGEGRVPRAVHHPHRDAAVEGRLHALARLARGVQRERRYGGGARQHQRGEPAQPEGREAHQRGMTLATRNRNG